MKYNFIPDLIIDEAKNIFDLIVAKKYKKIDEITNGERVPSSDIQRVIEIDYQINLYDPGINEFVRYITILRRATAFTNGLTVWVVEFPLWIIEEGVSDLIVILCISVNDEMEARIIFDSLKVL